MQLLYRFRNYCHLLKKFNKTLIDTSYKFYSLTLSVLLGGKYDLFISDISNKMSRSEKLRSLVYGLGDLAFFQTGGPWGGVTVTI